MKIGEYEQMMSYLTRPATETRENFAEAGSAISNSKFKQLHKSFKPKITGSDTEFANYLKSLPEKYTAMDGSELTPDNVKQRRRRLDLPTKFITTRGKTFSDEDILKEAKRLGVNLKSSNLRKAVAKARSRENKIKEMGEQAFLDREREYKKTTAANLKEKIKTDPEIAEKIKLQKQSYNQKRMFGLVPTELNPKGLLYRDLIENALRFKNGQIPNSHIQFKNKNTERPTSISKTQEVELIDTNVLDKKGKPKIITYDNVLDHIDDNKKIYKTTSKKTLNEYAKKRFIQENPDLRDKLNKKFYPNYDPENISSRGRFSPFHIHHTAGRGANAFNVQFATGTSNMKENRARRVLDKDFSISKSGTENKKALDKYIKNIPEDIEVRVGNKKFGNRPLLIDQLKASKIKMTPDQIKAATKLKASLLPGLEEIARGIKNIPDDIAKKKYFTLGLKALGPLGTYIAVDDTYEALKAGRPVAEALEYGLIGTNLIGSAKDLMALSPEEREARSVVKQAEMTDQIAQDESMLDTDFETPKVKSDLTREEAEEKFEAAKARRKLERESQEADIARARAISMSGLKDLITGKRFAGQEMPTQYMAAGGRMGFADGPDDPSRRKFMKIAGGIASIPLVGKYLKPAMVAAPKVVEVVKRSADGMPDFIGDLITKVVTLGKKSFSGNRADELAENYELDNYVVTQQGNKTTIKKVDDQGEFGYKENEMELEMDPETGGVTYNEASVRPDAEGKLKDVEEFIDDIDLEDMKKYTYDE